MADPRFFKSAGPFTMQELSAVSGAALHEKSDPNFSVNDVAPLDAAGTEHVSFLDNVKYRDQFKVTKAGACVVSPAAVELAPAGVQLLVTDNPYKAYARIAQAFYPDAPEGGEPRIDAGAIVKEGAEIGEGSWIESGAVIGENVVIGKGCRIGPNAVVTHAILGDHVRIYPGACVGQDGFGFAIDPSGHVKVPQLGRVILENGVQVGANTTIDRGAGPDTVIGAGTWIDNQVQIGHNVKIGRGCIIVAQVGVSGSTVLGDGVALGGQAGISGHLKIGSGARVGGNSGVIQDVPAGAEVMGYPAIPKMQFMRQANALKRLINKNKSS
jgi:UDP-3-O-[3-hydroxymyristoyl] glucosamine N-acyltransferase